jgi:RNA polymerase sigma-70 factor, ECF subfamily
LEDESIIERVLSGETDAYVEIVRRYQSEIWRVVVWSLGSKSISEDLVQQAFVNAYLKLETYDTAADFGVWLRTIARNLVRNELRRSSRESARMKHYHRWLDQRLDNLDETERLDAELRETLQHCREELAPTSARALQMRYEESLGFAEIADELGRTVEACRQLLTRTRLALRRCMSERRGQA